MKKLSAIVTIVCFLAACNNSKEDAGANPKDSVSAESPLTDAVNTADSVSRKIEDSTGKATDSIIK